MQASGREMQGGGGGQDDFFDQMLSTLPATWADLGSGKSPWELPAGASARAVSEDATALDEPALHASRLRHHQIGAGEKPLMLHLSDLHGLGAGDDAWFMPPLLFTQHRARNDMDVAFKSPNAAVGSLCSGTVCLLAPFSTVLQGTRICILGLSHAKLFAAAMAGLWLPLMLLLAIFVQVLQAAPQEQDFQEFLDKKCHAWEQTKDYCSSRSFTEYCLITWEVQIARYPKAWFMALN